LDNPLSDVMGFLIEKILLKLRGLKKMEKDSLILEENMKMMDHFHPYPAGSCCLVTPRPN